MFRHGFCWGQTWILIRYLMKSLKLALLLIVSLVLKSCEKEQSDIFKQEYFYYSFNYEKIPLYLSGSEVYLAFNKTRSGEEVVQFLEKYSFLSDRGQFPAISYKSLISRINESDTINLREILIQLNRDTALSYAVPVFTFDPARKSAFCIPTNEITCKPLISDDSFKRLISRYNLIILESRPDPYYLLKINKIVTGFEPLNISNSLYQTDKFYYCTPDFISSFEPL